MIEQSLNSYMLCLVFFDDLKQRQATQIVSQTRLNFKPETQTHTDLSVPRFVKYTWVLLFPLLNKCINASVY